MQLLVTTLKDNENQFNKSVIILLSVGKFRV